MYKVNRLHISRHLRCQNKIKGSRMGFTPVSHQSHPCSCKMAFYSTNGDETEGCASHAFKDGWHLGSTTVFYSTMNPECMHGRGVSERSLFLIKPREHWKCSCSLFQVHFYTVWEVFQHMGHSKWTGVVAYLFLSKLFSGLPLVLCDMPRKSACWELTISHWAHKLEGIITIILLQCCFWL